MSGLRTFPDDPRLGTPNERARCTRCPTTLHRAERPSVGPQYRAQHGRTRWLLLLIMWRDNADEACRRPVLRTALACFRDRRRLVHRGMPGLAAAVVFVTVIAPFGKLFGELYETHPAASKRRAAHHLRRVFVLTEKLRPWSMIEVFVFRRLRRLRGNLVMSCRSGSRLAPSRCWPRVFVVIWADSGPPDRQAVWDKFDRRGSFDRRRRRRAHTASCRLARSAAKLADW